MLIAIRVRPIVRLDGNRYAGGNNGRCNASKHSAAWRTLKVMEEYSAMTFQAGRSVLCAVLLLVGALSSPVRAHEPVFSLGPETIWEGGVGIELQFEFEDAGGEERAVLHYEIIYGLTANLSLTLEVPLVLERKEDGQTEHGPGDLEIRGKYQFFKKDMLGAQHKMAGILGVKAPTGDHDAKPPLGSGTTDILFGASYGYESRTWYHFLTTRYRWRTQSGSRDPGDRLSIDGAIGFRPFQTEYGELDAVFLLEMNAEFKFKDELRGTRLANTGGNTLWLGPTMLISPNPQWMFKGGIQFPVYEHLNGDQEQSEFRMLFGVEYHF